MKLDPPPPFLVRLAARIASWVLPVAHGAPPDPRRLRRVLVVRTDDRVGNALLTIPLARALANALPEARVDLLLASKRAIAAEGLPGISVIRFDKRARPIAYMAFLRELRRARYDAVIDAAHWHAFSLTSFLLSLWAASPRWLLGAQRGPSRLYSAAVPLPEREDKTALLQGLGLHPATPRLETALGQGAPLVQGRFAALNPGARKADHRWPAERYAEVARELKKRLRCVVFWGPGEEALARQVAQLSGAEVAPPTDLDQLAACLRAAALVITNDTGPMHLAVACGAPVVALFLDADGLRWAHPGPRFAAVVAPANAAPVLDASWRLLDSGQAPGEPARSLEETT